MFRLHVVRFRTELPAAPGGATRFISSGNRSVRAGFVGQLTPFCTTD